MQFLREKEEYINTYIGVQFNWLEYLPDKQEVTSSNLVIPTKNITWIQNYIDYYQKVIYYNLKILIYF